LFEGLLSHYRSEYTPRQFKILAFWGIFAVLLYLAALVVGNVLDPSYSQIGKTVSELIERGAPNRDLLDGMFVLFNLFLIPFAEGLYKGLNNGLQNKIIFLSLFLISVLGVVWTLLFPLDANGATTTFTGMMHLIIGVPVVFATLLTELSFWRAVRNDSRWQGYGRFSTLIFFVNLLAGLTTVAFVNSDIRGLLERFFSGSFLLWVMVLSLKLYKIHPRDPLNGHRDLGPKG
jgi:heme A synthase